MCLRCKKKKKKIYIHTYKFLKPTLYHSFSAYRENNLQQTPPHKRTSALRGAVSLLSAYLQQIFTIPVFNKMEVEEVEEAQRPQGATAAPPPPPPQPADDTTPRIHPSFEDPPPVGAAATVSVDDMAEELRGALLAQVNAETARLFSVDEFDGRFARLIKRFCLYLVSHSYIYIYIYMHKYSL